MKKNTRLVYSTDGGRVKNETEKPEASTYTDGTIRIQRETKGRNGKGVTVVSGFDSNEHDLKTMAKKLKQLCGTGGTAKDGTIEIQGDQRQKIKEYLLSQDLQVKISGG